MLAVLSRYLWFSLPSIITGEVQWWCHTDTENEMVVIVHPYRHPGLGMFEA